MGTLPRGILLALKAFREKASQFVYVKHFIIGDSILYGTDDLTDWPWEEWRHCPDTTVVRASGLYLATIREDGSVAQEELLRTSVKGVILDRRCIGCHDGSRPEPPLNKLGGAPEKATCFDLRGVPGNLPSSDDNAHRAYTRGYLNLSCYGFCNDMVNFSHGCDQVPFQQPSAFGASQSRYWQMLAKGHPDASGYPRVQLTDDELKTLAIWIDLGVPFVGGYCECNTWTDVQKRRYLWFQNKRVYFAGQELNDIRREKGLAPVAIDGYMPGIDCPDKMKNWFD